MHELAHVTRCDAAVNTLQILAQAMFFFHPLVRWANRKIRQEREKFCDEIAIARLKAPPREYGSAILENLLTDHKSRRAVPSLAIAVPVKNIEERIKTIMYPNRTFFQKPTAIAITTVLLLAALAIPTALVLTRKPVRKGPTQELKVNLVWNNETATLPAPVVYPEWGIGGWERWQWKRSKDMREFSTSDNKDYTYVANGLGFGADPDDPKGVLLPDISGVTRYNPEGTKEIFASWLGFHRPLYWNAYRDNGKEEIEVRKTSNGLIVRFLDVNGDLSKEWMVNKHGRVYAEQIQLPTGNFLRTQNHDDHKSKPQDAWWAPVLSDETRAYSGYD